MVIAFVVGAAPRVGTNTTLLIVIGTGVAAIGYGLVLFKWDVDDGFEALADTLDATRSDIVTGTATILARVNARNRRSDGGRPTGVVPDHVSFGAEPVSGIGALCGALAGAVVGVPFGSAVAVPLGVVGLFLGTATEYRGLTKRRHRKREAAATQFLRRAVGRPALTVELREVTEGSDETGDYWIFEFETPTGEQHEVVCYPERRRFVLADE